jgi:hypothetical protein
VRSLAHSALSSLLLLAGAVVGAGCTAATHYLVVGGGSNRRVVPVAVGQVLIVRLDSTNWTFLRPSGGGVVEQRREVVTEGPLACRVIGDCGSVTVRVVASSPGVAVIRATRQKCGELVYCDAHADSFRLLIRVHA